MIRVSQGNWGGLRLSIPPYTIVGEVTCTGDMVVNFEKAIRLQRELSRNIPQRSITRKTLKARVD